MPIRMRKNSLFGRLLRAPWWVSVLIGLSISAIVPAILVAKYAHFGVFIAIPFFVIGAIRASRQRGEPKRRDVAMVEETVRAMSPREFAKALTIALSEEGYAVTPSKAKGIDLELDNDGQITLMSCRRFKTANSGLAPLRALVSAGERHESAQLIYITILDVPPDVRTYADEHKIQVVGLDALTKQISQHLKNTKQKPA